MNPISKVHARIAEIEKKFNPQQTQQESSFSDYLKTAQSKDNDTISAIRKKPIQEQNTNYEKGSIKQMLVETAQKYGVDSNLVLALANAESGYRTDAVSPVGAVGVMQLMPDTARGLGVEDSFDPKQNIDGGVRYLKQMLSMFGGDTTKALAAYNAGPGAVQKYGGIPPYAETQAYVRNILSEIAQ